MPRYKVTVEIHVEGDDIDCVWQALDEIRDMEGVSVHSQAPHHDNPADYPEFGDD